MAETHDNGYVYDKLLEMKLFDACFLYFLCKISLWVCVLVLTFYVCVQFIQIWFVVFAAMYRC